MDTKCKIVNEIRFSRLVLIILHVYSLYIVKVNTVFVKFSLLFVPFYFLNFSLFLGYLYSIYLAFMPSILAYNAFKSYRPNIHPVLYTKPL